MVLSLRVQGPYLKGAPHKVTRYNKRKNRLRFSGLHDSVLVVDALQVDGFEDGAQEILA